MEDQKRGGFATNFGFLMAAIGSAVGLGNIWGFPYKMGANGGFAFLLVYIILAIFVGLAVMLGEMALGRKTGQSCVGAYAAMGKKYKWVGVCGVVAGFFILTFYMVLGGMVLRYVFGYLLAMFGSQNFGDPTTFFGRFITNGGSMLLWFFIFTLLNVIVIAGGVAGGIEKFNKIAMPSLFFLMLIVLIYVACQPGAGEGYKFMYAWNMEPLKEDFLKVVKTAAGQMFFSLSLGMSVMVTYGSYLNKKENLEKNALIVVVCDTLMAIMAGMIVLPACAAFGLEYGAGPGLLFSTMQVVFASMGGFIGNFIGFLFYLLVFLAAMSSSISVLEGVTAYFVDKNLKEGKGGETGGRKKACIIAAAVIFVVGILVALDGLGSGIEGGAAINSPAQMLGIEPQGWSDCWLDFFDMLSEGILMPLGSMMLAIFIGYVWKTDTIMEECEASGHKAWGHGFFKFCYKITTPIGMLIVLYGQITSFFG